MYIPCPVYYISSNYKIKPFVAILDFSTIPIPTPTYPDYMLTILKAISVNKFVESII